MPVQGPRDPSENIIARFISTLGWWQYIIIAFDDSLSHFQWDTALVFGFRVVPIKMRNEQHTGAPNEWPNAMRRSVMTRDPVGRAANTRNRISFLVTRF